MTQALSLLVVDDDRLDRAALVRAIGHAGIHASIEEAGSLSEGKGRLESRGFDCAVVDYRLPDGYGTELIEWMSTTGLSAVPLIFLTGHADALVDDELMRQGAQDYLEKGHVDSEALGRAIRHAIARHRIRASLALSNANLEELARRDALTDLLNRRGLERSLRELTRAVHTPQLVTLLVDCDDFRSINASHGHAVGDQLLVAVAKALRASTRSNDLVARVGGDEFLVVLPWSSPTEAMAVACRICEFARAAHVETPDGSLAKVTVSVGGAMVGPNHLEIASLLAATHEALQRSKGQGKDRAIWLTAGQELARDTLERLRLVENEPLHVVRQPIIDLAADHIAAYELLVRGPEGHQEPPHQLLQAARALDRLSAFDLRCLDVCIDEALSIGAHVPYHVNILASTLTEAGVSQIAERLQRAASQGIRLVLELDARSLNGLRSDLRRALTQLWTDGAEIAVDRLGMEEVDLAALLAVNPSVLKVAPEALEFAENEVRSRRALELFDAMARALGARLVVMGVSSAADLDLLREIGVRYAQGTGIFPPTGRRPGTIGKGGHMGV
jgi:diguanylate cyclase (GGDEF)-like protein